MRRWIFATLGAISTGCVCIEAPIINPPGRAVCPPVARGCGELPPSQSTLSAPTVTLEAVAPETAPSPQDAAPPPPLTPPAEAPQATTPGKAKGPVKRSNWRPVNPVRSL